jgi:hypothetical protein
VTNRMSHMRSQPRFPVPALAILAGAILAGCTGGGTSSAAHRATPSSSPRMAAGAQAGAAGSPGNPLKLSCAQESFPGYPSPPMSRQPGPSDLAIGPLFILNGKVQAPAGSGHHGLYPKVPFAVMPGSTVTVTIGARARGHVGIENPYAYMWGIGLVAAATYHPCSDPMGFFAQGFAFTHGQIRGCVPLDVRIDHQSLVRHITISLGAGSCAAST